MIKFDLITALSSDLKSFDFEFVPPVAHLYIYIHIHLKHK